MVNDLTTVEGAAQEVIDHLEQHLTNKGVIDAKFNPVTGIIGLVDRIPDIEPSVNINLTIDLSLTSSASTINYGESVVLTATLLASYEGVSEVDLQTGEITGATILFKNGSTIIGTGTTDSNGVATLTYTPTVSETTLSINAVFEGTDNFNRASSHNVSIEVNDYIDLTSDKDILSYVDGDEAVLTATLYSPDKIDKTVTFEVRKQSDDSLIETLTAVTDNSGIATVGYTSKGAGDLYIKCLCGLVSKRYEICDAIKYIDSVSKTFSSSSVEWYNLADLSSLLPSDFEITCKMKSSTNQGFRIDLSQSNQYENKSRYSIGVVTGTGINYKSLIYYNDSGTANDHPYEVYTANTDLNCKFHCEGNDMVLTIDNNDYTFTNVSNHKYIGIVNWNNPKTVTITDLKVKPL